ncbi:unnamed protein product [Hermetia illucens]|uniref:Vacuolar protein sorting-associated protein 11 homolog n=1 Tax=Hermetia illucens TaxID=343691 RepID=A0A7R8UYN9_HERIL|nr:vacuolar protein sorting-associated protein 11 homolog isoform X2 [Hermetia illucens]CAD7089452.1 unnamed protein product [Hermetia illucens]
MAIFEWRKFNFFDLSQGADNGRLQEAIKDAEITCATNGKNQIIICDSYGWIHVVYRNWDFTSFKGHDSPIALCTLSIQNNLLVTISSDDNGDVPVYKVWNLMKITKTNGAPCLRTVKAALQKPTSIAVTENGQFLAIGFDRGGISLYRGDIGRDRSKTLKTLSSGTSAITGIAFKQLSKVVNMFVCSDSGVLVYCLQSKDRETKIVLDKTYAPARCCALQSIQGGNESNFMVGRDDAIYCYTVDGRGPCYALDGQKCIIQWFRTHLLTITKSTKNILPSQKEFTLTVIDIQNKFIVYTTTIDAVAAILIEFGTCYIVTKTKEVYHLDEKDLQSKLNLLFKKNLYDIAIRIAKNQQYDAEGLAGIFKQYGDHLYGKGNYQGAVEQYIKTIGYLEPSYIIRRFLDSRHISYLTDYLEALHKQGQATADHTTLLLNCFTRLDFTDKLKDFLSNDGNPDIIFDLDVAIKVCRNASIDLALSLAKRNQKHDHSISILLEEMHAYEEALEYISNLPLNCAEKSLRKYGSILMEHSPDHTTELLKKLCTNYRPKGSPTMMIMESVPYDKLERANAEDFIQLFVKHSDKLIEFLEHLVANVTTCSGAIYNTLIELYLKQWQEDKSVEDRLLDILKTYDDVYDRDHILVLCRMVNFLPGILWLYEEQKLYHLVVRYHLKNRDYNGLISTCKRLGSNQPSLWLQALTGLRDDDKAPPTLLLQVLNVIASEKLQSPLQVLNCLAVENGPNLLHVRDYFLQVFKKEEEKTRQDEKDVEALKADLNTLKNHIDNMRYNPIEFRSTICNACQQPLSMPAVYFICQHSFHQDCIRTYSESEKDCSVCHARNSQLSEALCAQNEARNQHDTFHNILDRSHDPFSVVAEYFGRELFNNILIVDEPDNNEINQNTIQPVKPTIPTKEYGAGAEAKLRLQEGNKSGKPNIINIPGEGRLRLEESQKYSSSFIEPSQITIPIEMNRKLNESPRITPRASPKLQEPIRDKQLKQYTVQRNDPAKVNITNPFEYDDTKNPFAEEDSEDDALKGAARGPVKEYDSNLNPFE